MKPTRPYAMRTMPVDLHDRLRFLATRKRTTVEAIVVAALKLGLVELEQKARAQDEH